MNEIDFVIAWVDGSDEKWLQEKNEVLHLGKNNDDRKERYRDFEHLQYLFRGIEKFAPWVRKIHFVTWGHLPKWLETSNPKLHIVNHKDFIPEKYLPTYNSHTIELNFHRIKGLSENFVYFNDDMMLIHPLKPTDFFQDGKPVDMLALQPDVANAQDTTMPYIYLNNAMTLAKYFDKRENMKKQPKAYFHVGYPLMYFCYNFLEKAFPRFTGFYTVHGPSPLKKSTYEKLWHLEYELLDETCSHKVRDARDVNQYLLREYQKLSGEFVPKNVQKLCKYYDLSNDNTEFFNTIEKGKHKVVCMNDSNFEIDYEKVKKEIQEAFDLILPDKCSFEK